MFTPMHEFNNPSNQRNMKPTTITVNVHRYESGKGMVIKKETAVLTTIEGHEVYILESAINGVEEFCNGFTGRIDHTSNVYRENGERIRCAWVFGRTGKSLRWALLCYNAKTKNIVRTTNGLNGATGHGSGASLRLIDWDGSKYAAAIEQSHQTGKKLLHAF